VRSSIPTATLLCAFLFSFGAQASPLASVGAKTFISKNGKLWTEPNRFGEAVAELKEGLPVEVLDYDASRSWVLVKTPSGREGWVPLRFTSQDSRRTQPMISHKSTDASRSPAGFEETVAADEAEKVGVVNAGPAGGWPMDFVLGYSNQLNHENANGFSLGASLNFEIDSNIFWGVGLNWKTHFKSSEGVCFTTDQCRISRTSHRIYPHGLVEYRKDGVIFAVSLGLVIDHTGITTKNLTSGQIETTDGSGHQLTGSGNEVRLGFGVRGGYSFSLSPTMAIGPYVDYDLDLAFSDGTGEFAGNPAGKVFHLLGGGVIFQKAF
jgi:hypothetical protein